LDNTWQHIQFLSVHNPPIHLTNFFLFLKLEITLKGRKLQTEEDITTNMMHDLKAQTPFKQYFQKWKRRWERWIAVQGDYFEGDNIQCALSRERYYLQTNLKTF
jgi:hypothetical protein